MSATYQYWPSGGAQKMRFTNAGLGTHICAHSPTVYNMIPLTKAAASTPIQMGPNFLSGGVEFAPGAIPLEWPEMAYNEYKQLQSYHLVQSTMIDMYDNGYNGWLVLASHEPTAGDAMMVADVKATFIVSTPANGLISTINILAVPTLSYAVASGGSLAASTTFYAALSVFSQWGESALSPVIEVSTGSTANAMITYSWTAPESSFYRKARLYLSTSSFTSSDLVNVKAEIYSSFTQSFIDYCGINGVTSTATTPSANGAFTGVFSGGLWANMT